MKQFGLFCGIIWLLLGAFSAIAQQQKNSNPNTQALSNLKQNPHITLQQSDEDEFTMAILGNGEPATATDRIQILSIITQENPNYAELIGEAWFSILNRDTKTFCSQLLSTSISTQDEIANILARWMFVTDPNRKTLLKDIFAKAKLSASEQTIANEFIVKVYNWVHFYETEG
jgi:hypothetical protein